MSVARHLRLATRV